MKIPLFVLTLILSIHCFSQEKFSVSQGETLIEGYDPVSFFSGNPSMGREEIFVVLEGRKLLFSSIENKTMFELNPEKYRPQYGGWCAIAMVEDTFVIPNYKFYKIQDERLFFFRVQGFFNGLTHWNKDPDKNKIKADTNYAMHSW